MRFRSHFAALIAGMLLAACASASPPPVEPEGRLYDGKPLSYWLEEVRDLSPPRSAAAARALSFFGEGAAPAIPELIRGLAFADSGDCGACRDALVAIGALALPPMEAALQGPDEATRESAGWVLWALIEEGHRSPTLIHSLVRALEDRGGACRPSFGALGALGTEAAAALPAMEKLLAEESAKKAAGQRHHDVEEIAQAVGRVRGQP